ncbi:MAG: hypothetical protein R3B93_22885 [Bacteroidia bacterium]
MEVEATPSSKRCYLAFYQLSRQASTGRYQFRVFDSRSNLSDGTRLCAGASSDACWMHWGTPVIAGNCSEDMCHEKRSPKEVLTIANAVLG